MNEWIKRGSRIRCIQAFTAQGRYHTIDVPVGHESVIQSCDRGSVVLCVSKGQNDLIIRLLMLDFLSKWAYVPPLPPRNRPKRSMIVPVDPSHPNLALDLKKRQPVRIYIGYWASSPDPNKDSYEAAGVELPWPEDHVDKTWDPAIRDRVIRHLLQAPKVIHYMGFALCRCCGRELGCSERDDGTYHWPDGFEHYLQEHGVRPPGQFIQHVLSS